MAPKADLDTEAATRMMRLQHPKTEAAMQGLTGKSRFLSALSDKVKQVPGMPLTPFVPLALAGASCVAKPQDIIFIIGSSTKPRNNNGYFLTIAGYVAAHGPFASP